MSEAAPPPAPPAERVSFFRLFPSIMLPMFLAMVDTTIVTTAIPAIAAQLGNVEQMAWIIACYLITAAIVTPVYGRMGDVIGRRKLMAVALTVSMLGSLSCALSTSMEMLILSRILQGLGGGGLMTLSQALIGQSLPPEDRPRYQGYLAMVAVSASAFAPVVGGFLTQHFGWQSIFLVNVPLALLAIFLTFRLPARNVPRQPFRFDFAGLLLFAAFITSLLLFVEQVRRPASASLPLALTLAAIAVLALPLLYWQERRARTPLLPIPLLSNPTIWRSDCLAMCHGAAFVSLLTFLPVYLSAVRGVSPAELGLLILPVSIGAGCGSVLTGQIMNRTRRTAIYPSVGLMVASALLVYLSLDVASLSSTQATFGFGMVTLMLGTVMGVVQVNVQSEADPRLLGIAAASVQLSRSMGAALGTALAGAVLFAIVANGAAMNGGLVDGHALQAILQGDSRLLGVMGPERVAALRADMASGFRVIFAMIAVYAGIGSALAWSIPRRWV